MSNSKTDQAIAAHYAKDDLTGRILKALETSTDDSGVPSLAALAKVDQLHHGGLGLTERLIKAADIRQGMHVLDAGSGIGGSARHLVAACGCTIEAIDLTPEFVRTAAELDKLVGLSDSINHRVGSVTDLPYGDDSFDAVWSQNVTMNIDDKASMFAQALRVLRPGGVFAFTHIASGTGGSPEYPVPWAGTPDTSFPSSSDEILRCLTEAGFEMTVDHAAGTTPGAPPPPGDGPDDTVVMGEDMPLRRANTMRAVDDGRLIPMMVTARRPA